MWLTMAAAVADLRRLLADGPTDKIAFNKKVLGVINGTNKQFKTFERRRNTDFTQAPTGTSPEGVYVNGARLGVIAISSDDPESGGFILASAPADGSTLTSCYYYRWFNDPELEQFITNAIQMVLSTTSVTTVVDGLIPAVLHFAAGEAYQRLALHWTTNLSSQYMLEDAPRDRQGNLINPFADLQDKMEKKAMELRKNYYARNDQAEQPLFGTISGAVRDQVPRR